MHDSHIHISMSPLKENIQEDIQEFIELGGKKILAQTTDMTNYQDTIDMYKHLNSKFPDTIDLALGIHPTRIEEGISKNELDSVDIFQYMKKQYEIFEEVLNKNIKDVTAIGECGLDYFSMNQYSNFTKEKKEQIKEAQRLLFSKLCKLAVKYNLPMSIHARDIDGSSNCVKDVLAIIAKEGRGTIKGSFHSYTGDIKMLDKILSLGMYVGFNAIITYPSGENVREILKEVPVERILFETDGPFLPTQSVRKRKNSIKKYGRPALIKEIIEKACEVKNIEYKRIEEITDNNYFTLFSKQDK